MKDTHTSQTESTAPAVDLSAARRALSMEYDFTDEQGEHFRAISTEGPGQEMPLVIVMLRGDQGHWCARAFVGVQMIEETTADKCFTASMQIARLTAEWRQRWYQNFIRGEVQA